VACAGLGHDDSAILMRSLPDRKSYALTGILRRSHARCMRSEVECVTPSPRAHLLTVAGWHKVSATIFVTSPYERTALGWSIRGIGLRLGGMRRLPGSGCCLDFPIFDQT
jgi:hypothetical protein